MKANIKKISEITGFSPATISNALNNKKGVNDETRSTILKTAKNLNYNVENSIKNIKFVIYKKNGLIIDNSPFFSSVIEGVTKRGHALGYETTIVHVDKSSPDFFENINKLVHDSSSAFILLGTEMQEEDFNFFENARDNLVLLDGWSDTISFDSVLIANTDSAVKATNYLFEKGHKKIGYLKGNYRIKAFLYREYGFRRVLLSNNLPIDEFIFEVGTTIETAYKDMKKILESNKKMPTAFFADDDVIALGAMRALKENGYSIPDDISIIGFDNLSYGEISSPRLTTINVFKQEMGEIAVNRLFDKIKNNSKIATKIQVCTEFVIRNSVKELKLNEKN